MPNGRLLHDFVQKCFEVKIGIGFVTESDTFCGAEFLTKQERMNGNVRYMLCETLKKKVANAFLTSISAAEAAGASFFNAISLDNPK